MGTHSYQTSPSRRGRRIFDFGAETLLRAAAAGGGDLFGAASIAAAAATTTAGAQLLPSLPPPPFAALSGAGALPNAAISFSPFLAALAALKSQQQQPPTSTAPSRIQPPLPPPPQLPRPISPPTSGADDTAAAMLWLFKMCSVCQKICTSPDQLQEHLRTHIETESAASIAD